MLLGRTSAKIRRASYRKWEIKMIAKTTTFICSCGCGAKDDACPGWLSLESIQAQAQGRDLIKVSQVHFASLGCLNRWLERAMDAAPGLVKSARALSPRSMMTVPGIEGLWV